MQKFLAFVTAVIFFHTLGADGRLALAVVLPPETAVPKEETVPSEVAPEPESGSHVANPFEESAKPDAYEAIKQKRQRTILYIILGIVLLLCAYWWTFGKLHHKIPD